METETTMIEYLKTLMPLIVGIGVAVFSWYLHRQKYKAEVDSIVIDTADKVIDIYKNAVDNLTDRVMTLEEQNNKLRLKVQEIERDYAQKYENAKRRMDLLAKIIVVMLKSRNDIDSYLNDFIESIRVSTADKTFLREIIEEAHNQSSILD